jgi:glycosyltransferase involved in cell wall biosynthesis
LAILKEYAERDSRIEIIDQVNQGGGSARNAAYPHIKGTFTFFADPDDWLNLELCEKAVRKIEATDADVVYFHALREYPTGKSRQTRKFKPNLPDVRITPEQRVDLFRPREVPWLKLWKSGFLLKHQIRFSDGKRPYNDMVQSWKGNVLAERIAILDEPLYHHRCFRPGSYQEIVNKSHYVIVDTLLEIESMLRETGKYADYRSLFLKTKLTRFRQMYFKLASELRPEFRTLILGALTEDERCFLRYASPQISHQIDRCFYRMLERQGFFDTAMFRLFGVASRCFQYLRSLVLRLK